MAKSKAPISTLEISKAHQAKHVEDQLNNIFWVLKNRCFQTPEVIRAIDSLASTYSEVLAAIRDHYCGKSEVLNNPTAKAGSI